MKYHSVIYLLDELSLDIDVMKRKFFSKIFGLKNERTIKIYRLTAHCLPNDARQALLPDIDLRTKFYLKLIINRINNHLRKIPDFCP